MNEQKPFTGIAVEHWPSGQKKLEAEYRDGTPQGRYKTWNENGRILMDLEFNDGKTVGGVWTIAYPHWYDCGEEPLFDPVIKKLFTGRTVTRYPGGHKRTEAQYCNGMLHGKRTLWYENGQKSWEAEFREGKLHGKNTQWYENGQKRGEGRFQEGRQHGKTTGWYKDGRKSIEAEFRDGEYCGKLTIFYESGEKEMEAEFRDGKLLKAECWNEEGNPAPCPELDEKLGRWKC